MKRFLYYSGSFFLLIFFLPSACITTKSEGLILKTRVDALEKRVSRIDADFPLLVDFSTSGRKELERISRQQAELLAQLEEIKQSFLVFGGKLEENQNLPSRLDSLNLQLQDLSRRISALEEVISPERKELNTAKLNFGWRNEEDGYRDAYASYQAQQYALARAKFEKLIELYPEGQFKDNARYWIGECFYQQKDYERAILNFNEVVEKYPKSGKVPNALLKMGMALMELNKKKEARLAFETVIARFPNSEPAKIAKEKLNRLK